MRPVLISIGLAAGGCVATHGPASGDLQMNDLSILLPLATTDHAFASYLLASSPGLGGALLPQPVFASAQTQGLAYGELRVVAFRFDPCFGHLGAISDPSTCQHQLRVVFQPLTFSAGATTAEDAAVHAFYTLTRDQLTAAVREVSAARVASGGAADLGAVAVHPIVLAQGLDGMMAASLTSIITKYAGAANLTRFTTLSSAGIFGPTPPPGTGGEQRFWNFEGFDVSGGTLTPLPIPTLADGTTNVKLVTNGTEPLEATLSPATTSPDDVHLLASSTRARAATAHDQQAAFDATLRIENPGLNSPNTIDCASCHTAEPARELVGQLELGLSDTGNGNAFVADPSIPVDDLATTTSVISADGSLNIHAFSYRGTLPMINRRVVNETAANLAYLATAGLSPLVVRPGC